MAKQRIRLFVHDDLSKKWAAFLFAVLRTEPRPHPIVGTQREGLFAIDDVTEGSQNADVFPPFNALRFCKPSRGRFRPSLHASLRGCTNTTRIKTNMYYIRIPS